MKVHVLMENTAMDSRFAAEHGLSLLLETRRHRILFDAGQSSAFADNAARMGLDLREVDLCVLSHGHYDHGGGLKRFLELNDHAPVYLSRHAFESHWHGSEKYIGLDTSLEASERLIRVADRLDIDEELSLLSCNGWRKVEPTDSFGLCVKSGDALLPDDFRHEQYLLVRDEGREILFSGCSHKGILNIARWFALDALVGGFHFTKLDPDAPEDRSRLEAAAKALLQSPTRYFTGHCTGARQFQFLKQIMGERLEAISTGMTLEI